MALLNDFQFNDKDKAAEFYKKIMFDYQSSIYVVDSRKRYRYLREKENIIAIGDVPEEIYNYHENLSKDLDIKSEKDAFFYSLRPNGNYKIYNTSGKITREGVFKDWKLMDGKWYRYNEKDELIEIQIFKEGKLIGKEPLQ